MSNEGRLQTCKLLKPAQHRIVDAHTSYYAETYVRWQPVPEGIGGVLLLAKNVRA